MKNLILIFFTILLFVSCSDDSNIGSPSEPVVDEDPSGPTEALIDDSDLFMLPKDLGGQFTAFPLGSNESSFGHTVYLPSGYEEGGPAYPLLIFLQGSGARGDSSKNPNDLNKLDTSGPPKLIRSGQWNPSYPFIVVSPQALTDSYYKPEDLHVFINYLLDKYQINPNRIYLTGLSLGGGGCWFYVGEIDEHHAAAIVPICASGVPELVENLQQVPIWAFHGADDTTVLAFEKYGSAPMVQMINETSPLVKAKVTIFPDTGHNSWDKTYNGTGMFQGDFRYDQYDMNLYDWMLQFKRTDR